MSWGDGSVPLLINVLKACLWLFYSGLFDFVSQSCKDIMVEFKNFLGLHFCQVHLALLWDTLLGPKEETNLKLWQEWPSCLSAAHLCCSMSWGPAAVPGNTLDFSVLLPSSQTAADFQLQVSCALGFLSQRDSWPRQAPPSVITTWKSPGRRSEEPLESPPLFTGGRGSLYVLFLWLAGQSGPAGLGRQSRWGHRGVPDKSRTFTQVLLFVGGLQS